MRYITLKKEEIEVLEHLHQNSPNNTVRKRSQCLVLSHQRRKINDLVSIFKVSRRTIERWFDSWAEIGVDSPWNSRRKRSENPFKRLFQRSFRAIGTSQ